MLPLNIILKVTDKSNTRRYNDMSVNGITNTTVAYQYATSGAVKDTTKKATRQRFTPFR